MPTKGKTVSKSDFIRQQPASMPAADVVKKAKAQSIKLTPMLVYKVRGRAKAKANKHAAPASKPAATTKAAAATESKAEFIRSLPASMSAADVVKAGAAKGMKFADTYVYWARGYGRRKTSPKAARRAGHRLAAAVARPIASTSAAETLLKAVAAEIGLGQAVEILQAERARVRAAIGG